jgi:hypothetical protein
MAMRTEVPCCPWAVLEGSDDFHPHSLIACPRIPAIDTGFLDFYRNRSHASGEDRRRTVGCRENRRTAMSCLASGCERYVHSSLYQRHLQNFMSRLANLKINSVCVKYGSDSIHPILRRALEHLCTKNLPVRILQYTTFGCVEYVIWRQIT